MNERKRVVNDRDIWIDSEIEERGLGRKRKREKSGPSELIFILRENAPIPASIFSQLGGNETVR